MLKRAWAVGIAFCYVALANFCVVCGVRAEVASTKTGGHCPMSSPEASCCELPSTDESNDSNPACSFSMDEAAANLVSQFVSAPPAFDYADILAAPILDQSVRAHLLAARNNGPPDRLEFRPAQQSPFQGRSPPFLA